MPQQDLTMVEPWFVFWWGGTNKSTFYHCLFEYTLKDTKNSDNLTRIRILDLNRKRANEHLQPFHVGLSSLEPKYP